MHLLKIAYIICTSTYCWQWKIMRTWRARFHQFVFLFICTGPDRPAGRGAGRFCVRRIAGASATGRPVPRRRRAGRRDRGRRKAGRVHVQVAVAPGLGVRQEVARGRSRGMLRRQKCMRVFRADAAGLPGQDRAGAGRRRHGHGLRDGRAPVRCASGARGVPAGHAGRAGRAGRTGGRHARTLRTGAALAAGAVPVPQGARRRRRRRSRASRAVPQNGRGRPGPGPGHSGRGSLGRRPVRAARRLRRVRVRVAAAAGRCVCLVLLLYILFVSDTILYIIIWPAGPTRGGRGQLGLGLGKPTVSYPPKPGRSTVVCCKLLKCYNLSKNPNIY